jgi:hypothetical protein
VARPTKVFASSPATSPTLEQDHPTLQSSALAQPPATSNYQVTLDILSKLAIAAALHLESGLSFAEVCIRHRGPSCLPSTPILSHNAGPLLSALRNDGAVANLSTRPWSTAQLDEAAKRGPHQSTMLHVDFMRQEFAEMVLAGQWLVLPYSMVQDLPNLHLSPTGVVPQCDRRPRPIVDYSYSGINEATTSHAPDSIQFVYTPYAQFF